MATVKKGHTPQFNYDIRVDLHGLTAEDALTKIDHVICTNLQSSIMIIHGRGSGILRNKIRDYLNSSPIVDTVYCGEQENIPGGDGITIAYTV